MLRLVARLVLALSVSTGLGSMSGRALAQGDGSRVSDRTVIALFDQTFARDEGEEQEAVLAALGAEV